MLLPPGQRIDLNTVIRGVLKVTIGLIRAACFLNNTLYKLELLALK